MLLSLRLGTAFTFSGALSAAPANPNIIVVLADDLGYPMGESSKLPMLSSNFPAELSPPTRDLTALTDEGSIEFIGATRTGFYQLC